MSILSEETIRPWLVGDFGRELAVYRTIGSTNDAAKLLAKNGAPHGAAVVSGHQSAGKGRLGRKFYSPEDTGIYLTVILRPQWGPEQSLSVTSAAAVAVARAIERVTGIFVQIKWVNDLYFGGKKLCGILAESALGQGGKLEYVVVGIGVNVATDSFPPELSEIATSLAAAGGKEINRARLAAEILNEFSTVYNHLESRSFMEEYRSRSCVIGRKATLLGRGEPLEITILDISRDAHLIAETADGERLGISSGEVSLKGDWR